MARIKRGILGGFQGKVANVVGSSWKGIETMRSLPLSVLNPRTAAQVGNRTRFGSLSTLGAAILTSIIKPLNDRFAQQMSGYNLFTSRNKAAFTAEGVFVPVGLAISSGKLGDPTINDVAAALNGSLQVTFPVAPAGAYEQGTDKAYCVAIDDDGQVVGVSSGSVARSAGSLVMESMRGLVEGEGIHFYLAFLRVDGTIVSNSAYMSGLAAE